MTVHEDYSGMKAWHGGGSVDITYDDTEGVFTKSLVENSHLDDIWINAMPKYYPEVKTTTKECNARFSASKSQSQIVRKPKPKPVILKLTTTDG